MYHVRHLNIIRYAKVKCDYLTVGVCTDDCVMAYKRHTPIIPYEQRAAIVASIKYVDEVVPQTSMGSIGFPKTTSFRYDVSWGTSENAQICITDMKDFAKFGAYIE